MIVYLSRPDDGVGWVLVVVVVVVVVIILGHSHWSRSRSVISSRRDRDVEAGW